MSWRARSGRKLKKKHASPSVTMGAALPMIVGLDKLVAFAAGIRFVDCRLHRACHEEPCRQTSASYAIFVRSQRLSRSIAK